MAREDKFVTESQLKHILTEVMSVLMINEDNKLSKDLLEFKLSNVTDIVNKLNITLRKVHEFSIFQRKIYIPVKNQTDNNSPFDVNLSLITNATSAVIGLYIPPKYSQQMTLTPVVTFMNLGVRNLLSILSIKFIEVSRVSQLGVKEFYYEIDLNIESLPGFSNLVVDIVNHEGITEVITDIYKGDPAADTTVSVIKEITIDAEVKNGFDDIPNRDKLVRSNTIKFYEVVSQDQYQNMESVNGVNSETVYSIPERLQITE